MSDLQDKHVKLIYQSVTMQPFYISLSSLHVSATLSHLQVFGPKSFTLQFLVFEFKT
jgi:hypothetical protein